MAISTAIDINAVARVVGIKTEFTNLRGGAIVNLPQRIAVFGQGNSLAVYPLDKFRVTSASQAAQRYGYGSPIHLAVQQLLPDNGDGVSTIPVTIYPLEDSLSGVAAAGDITPTDNATAAGSFTVLINNKRSSIVVLAVGDTPTIVTGKIIAAINGVLDMPVIASDGTDIVELEAKWAGESSNGLYVEIEGGEDLGVTFAITQPVGGLANPEVDTALAQMGNIWETLVLNCQNIDDLVALDEFNSVGEGRWGATFRKPYICFTGNTLADVNAAIAVSDSRKTDRINAQLVAPGSHDLPFVVASRQIARIAVRAQSDPAFDYGGQSATGLVPGTDGEQWDYINRDLAVKAGSSTVEVRDSVVTVSDVVTFFHPTGETTPAYRYVVDIIKIMNINFNADMIFVRPDWDGAPLVPQEQSVTNPDAKKPSMAVAEIAKLIDNLAEAAIIVKPKEAKSTIRAEINSQNPKRLDTTSIMQIVGNTNIISYDFFWGFYFGSS